MAYQNGCICGNENCNITRGYCHCGCGKETTVSKRTDTHNGWAKGIPKRFCDNHHARIRPVIEQAAPFKIDGVYCRLIPLSQGQFSIVEEADYEWLMAWKWAAQFCKKMNSYYACRNESHENGTKDNVRMHRLVLGVSDPKLHVDHIKPGNTLDNRRSNLREATASQNNCNAKLSKANTSGFKGVWFYKRTGKWHAGITINRQKVSLGYFDTPEEASVVRERSALKLHGAFARMS